MSPTRGGPGRPVLDKGRVERRHDRSTVEGRVFSDLAHLGEVRAGLPQLSADVRTVVAPVDDEGVLVTYRDHRAAPSSACTT